VRTIFWVLLAVALVLFAINNWVPVEVRIWDNLLLESKLAALVIAAFLLGLVPTWLLYRTTRWRLNRRIATLESTLSAQRPLPPLATSTQLESGTA
jgi:hypothetical protein